MTKTVSLRIDEELYNSLKVHAEAENRSISNFIETATMKYIEEIEYADELEMENILSNEGLVARIKQGTEDANSGRGRLV
ncbi:MAG: ribbon-helix-helix protein, CopG family [Spirochaetaceae bacterium]|nr:MAG: ribbon-helix-helix protein, CopG family [Spirochaetaceae bacterium]